MNQINGNKNNLGRCFILAEIDNNKTVNRLKVPIKAIKHVSIRDLMHMEFKEMGKLHLFTIEGEAGQILRDKL